MAAAVNRANELHSLVVKPSTYAETFLNNNRTVEDAILNCTAAVSDEIDPFPGTDWQSIGTSGIPDVLDLTPNELTIESALNYDVMLEEVNDNRLRLSDEAESDAVITGEHKNDTDRPCEMAAGETAVDWENVTLQDDSHKDMVHIDTADYGDECRQCKVCGDNASGMYFGARVCVPCKV